MGGSKPNIGLCIISFGQECPNRLKRCATPVNAVRKQQENIIQQLIVGELPLSRSKSRYILTHWDLSTRYPDAEPLKKITTKAVATALLKIFSRLTFPAEILSDNGPNLTSAFMREVFKSMKIQHIKTSPYQPQTNGCIERFHRTLIQMTRNANKPSLAIVSIRLSGCPIRVHRIFSLQNVIWSASSWTT